MANYGDVALGLKADWSRNVYENNSDWMLYTVGHQDGTADVYLKAEPDKAHQFRWVDTRDVNEVTRALMQGYHFVKKDEWEKHEILWAWDSEDCCIFAGQKLMARPKEAWLKDQTRRDTMFKKSRDDSDRDMDAAPHGLVPTDGQGKPISRRKKGI